MIITTVLSTLSLAACGGVKVAVSGEEYGDEGKVFTTSKSGVAYIPVKGGEYTICVETESTCRNVTVPESSVIPVKP